MARKKQKAKPDAPPLHNGERTVALNRRAHYDYQILDTYDAGLVLTGSEIKSIRGGNVSLREGYVQVFGGEAFLYGVHIALYKPASHFNHDPDRPKKLLLHKPEILRLGQHLNAHGNTAVPLRLYLANGYAKVQIGVGRGRTRYDKRERIAEREVRRQIERRLRR